jgi:hypothetical protein
VFAGGRPLDGAVRRVYFRDYILTCVLGAASGLARGVVRWWQSSRVGMGRG